MLISGHVFLVLGVSVFKYDGVCVRARVRARMRTCKQIHDSTVELFDYYVPFYECLQHGLMVLNMQCLIFFIFVLF